ncbi:MAG: hypothetical protein KF681_06560 [Bdellovibrionaceae bacterium]|nr:hypothetical protein [Pseudobdellovibrionaceae bacterium]
MKRLVSISLLALIFSVLSLAAALADACPLGPRETELSLARVMRNFGRGTMQASTSIQRGTRDAGDVTEAMFKASIDGLAMAQSCVEAALTVNTREMLPLKARDLSGAALDSYMVKYHALMREFAVILNDFRNEFIKQSELAVGQRDFGAAAALEKTMNEKVNEAHGLL